MHIEQTIADLTQKVQRLTAAIGVLQEMVLETVIPATTTPGVVSRGGAEGAERGAVILTTEARRHRDTKDQGASNGKAKAPALGLGARVLEVARGFTEPFGHLEVHQELKDRKVLPRNVRDALNYAVKMGKLKRVGRGEYAFEGEGTIAEMAGPARAVKPERGPLNRTPAGAEFIAKARGIKEPFRAQELAFGLDVDWKKASNLITAWFAKGWLAKTGNVGEYQRTKGFGQSTTDRGIEMLEEIKGEIKTERSEE